MPNDMPLSALPLSPFLRLNALLKDVPPGAPPLALSVGEPQTPVPDFVAPVLNAALSSFANYPPIHGTDGLRAAIAAWLTKRYALPGGMIDASAHVLPLSGSREGLFLAAFTVVPKRKNGSVPAVLLPNPFYQAYPAAALASGGEPIYVNALPAHGFLPDFAGLPETILARTALVFIASPSNPEGAVADLAYWKQLFELSDRYGFSIFSDECYSEIYPSAPPPGALEAAHRLGRSLERLLVFNSLSKRSGLAGLRSGFVAGDPALIARYRDIRASAGPQMPGPLQAVSTAAWSDEAHVEANRAFYRANFEAASECLGAHPGFALPAGGFFLWLRTGQSVYVSRRLWAEAGVRSVPGEYLGVPGHGGENPGINHVRLALVNPVATTRTALKRVAETLARLPA